MAFKWPLTRRSLPARRRRLQFSQTRPSRVSGGRVDIGDVRCRSLTPWESLPDLRRSRRFRLPRCPAFSSRLHKRHPVQQNLGQLDANYHLNVERHQPVFVRSTRNAGTFIHASKQPSRQRSGSGLSLDHVNSPWRSRTSSTSGRRSTRFTLWPNQPRSPNRRPPSCRLYAPSPASTTTCQLRLLRLAFRATAVQNVQPGIQVYMIAPPLRDACTVIWLVGNSSVLTKRCWRDFPQLTRTVRSDEGFFFKQKKKHTLLASNQLIECCQACGYTITITLINGNFAGDGCINGRRCVSYQSR